METQTTTTNTPMEAYIMMLHLVSQKWAYLTDIKDLLFWEKFELSGAVKVLEYINDKITELSDEWGEVIPFINMFVFKKEGSATTWVCEHFFDKDYEKQPTPQQIAEYAAKIGAYENWDNVLKQFRKEAFRKEALSSS